MNFKFLVDLEEGFDRLRLNFKKSLNLIDPIIIFPYRGYANDHELKLSGRVLEREGILKSNVESNSMWSKIHHMFKRFESDEIPHIKVQARFKGQEKVVETDKEGFFALSFSLDHPLKPSQEYWEMLDLQLLNNPYSDQKDVSARGSVLVPGKNSNYMVISDVDDTIIKSFATSTFLKVKTLVTETAKTRTPFNGVASFYRALQRQDDIFNPLFFVSGSSWNIYDLLERFCKINEIPDAPFFLRKLGINKNVIIQKGTRKFKKQVIEHLMSFYPDLPAILIGDSGQKDIEIYGELALKQPDRVNAIYIRKINDKPLSLSRQQMVDDLKNKNIDLLLVDNTYEAAEHAASNGWIKTEELKTVGHEVETH